MRPSLSFLFSWSATSIAKLLRRHRLFFLLLLTSTTCLIYVYPALYYQNTLSGSPLTKPSRTYFDNRTCLDGSVPYNKTLTSTCSFSLVHPSNTSRQAHLAGRVAKRLKSLYIEKIKQHFNNNYSCEYGNRVKVIEYNCVDGNGISLCGGFGDRSRGLVSLFYMALMTNSIFHVNWTIPIDLGRYFRINADLYEVPRAAFRRAVTDATSNVIGFMDKDSGIKQYALDPGFLDNQTLRKVAITTNSFMGFQSIFSQPKWASSSCRYFSHFDRSQLNRNILVSAALRFVYGEPKPELGSEIEKVIEKKKSEWNSTTKIGVQVRLENLEWKEHGRIALSQVNCFFEEVFQLIRKLGISRPLVYVTSDNANATAMLLNMFQQAKIQAFSDDVHPDLLHTDRTSPDQQVKHGSSNDEIRRVWMMHVRSFVDWLMLTKMDYLVISRSGFSETAHMYSLAPTRRFVHQKVNSNNSLQFNDKCRFQAYSIPADLEMEVNHYIA